MWNWIKRLFKKEEPKKEIPEEESHTRLPAVIVVVAQKNPEVSIPEYSNKLIEVIDNINNGNASKPDWTYLVTTCQIDADKKLTVLKAVNQQKLSWDRYKYVSSKTGVPARVIANIHYKESSGDFNRCLHNGDRVIGNGKKTWQVPKGRGPFATWEEAAIDALMMKKSIFPSRWTTVESLIFSQRYNGMGHQNKGLEYTPYVWAYTSHHDETGNYIADGKYSSSAVIKSPGVMALMIAQEEMGLV